MRLTRLLSAVGAVSFSVIVSSCGGGGDATGVVVGPPASITPASGSTSFAAAGQTTPITLVAKVSDAGGHAVSGAAITWSTSFGSIAPATASTDANGQSTAMWTPGTVSGAATAAATVTGKALTASFTATVTAGPLAKIKVSPDTMKLVALGATGQITATSTDAFDNVTQGTALTYGTSDPSIATVTTTGLVTAVGNGKTTIDVASGSIHTPMPVIVAAISQAVQCDPAASVSLAVGESRTFTGASAGQICLTGATGAEFVAIPFYATGNGGTGSGQGSFAAAPTLQLTLNPVANTFVTGLPTPSIASNSRIRASVSTTGEPVLTRDVAWEARFRQRVYKEFSPMIATARRNAQQSSRAGGARLDLGFSAATVPAIGDTMQLNVNVNASCAIPSNASSVVQLVKAVVRSVSNHAIVVDDIRNPTGGFSDIDFQSFATTFDNQVWPVDSTNFGAPTDFDNNGHIIIFFTRAVNELTPPNSSSFVGGFFFGRDLFHKTDGCGNGQTVVGSNEAEMFYMLTPDPNGTINNNIRTTSFVKSISIGTIGHEFQHLINFGRHLYINPVLFTAFEVPFLDEGLAHTAEELNYYAATGRSPRTDADASATSPGDLWASFQQQNAVRFREYLKNTDRYPPYSVLADTSLAVRGGIWSFLRYAADRHISAGPEKNTWFQLVNPTSDVNGINNLSAVFGSDILLQMRDWAVSNYVDDLSGVSAFFQQPSWNIRSVETWVTGPSFANGTTYPLKVQSLVNSPLLITLADGGAAYLRFGVGSGSFGGATVTSTGALPQTLSITVVRTK